MDRLKFYQQSFNISLKYSYNLYLSLTFLFLFNTIRYIHFIFNVNQIYIINESLKLCLHFKSKSYLKKIREK